MGKRLRPYTVERPKPMIEIAGKPIIRWQIEWLKTYGVSEFVLLVGYLKEKIIEYFGSGSRFGVKISYIVEDEPLGTGGALKNAEHVLKHEEVFLVLNGDIITDLDPLRLVKALEGSDKLAAIAAVPLRSPYGILKISSDDEIVDFVEKPTLREYWINAGVYAIKPEAFKFIPSRGDIEKTGFPELAKERKLLAVRYADAFWKSIDTHKDVEEASEEVRRLGYLGQGPTS